MKINDFTYKYDCVQVEINQKRAQIESLQKEIQKLKNEINISENWVNIILEPLANKIAEILGYPYFEIKGVLTRTVSFAKSKKDLDNTSITITFQFKPSILSVLHENEFVDVTQMTVDELIRKLNIE